MVQVSRKSVRILRIMLSGIFLIAGANHLFFPNQVAIRLMESGVYKHVLFFADARLLVMATGIGLLAGGVLMILNRYTRYAAMLLLGLLIPITLVYSYKAGTPQVRCLRMWRLPEHCYFL